MPGKLNLQLLRTDDITRKSSAETLLEAQPLFVTDTNKLYIGKIKIGTTLTPIKELLPVVAEQLVSPNDSNTIDVKNDRIYIDADAENGEISIQANSDIWIESEGGSVYIQTNKGQLALDDNKLEVDYLDSQIYVEKLGASEIPTITFNTIDLIQNVERNLSQNVGGDIGLYSGYNFTTDQNKASFVLNNNGNVQLNANGNVKLQSQENYINLNAFRDCNIITSDMDQIFELPYISNIMDEVQLTSSSYTQNEYYYLDDATFMLATQAWSDYPSGTIFYKIKQDRQYFKYNSSLDEYTYITTSLQALESDDPCYYWGGALYINSPNIIQKTSVGILHQGVLSLDNGDEDYFELRFSSSNDIAFNISNTYGALTLGSANSNVLCLSNPTSSQSVIRYKDIKGNTSLSGIRSTYWIDEHVSNEKTPYALYVSDSDNAPSGFDSNTIYFITE